MKVVHLYDIKKGRLIQRSVRIATCDELFPPTLISRISMPCEPDLSGYTISGTFNDCNLPQMLDEIRQYLRVLESMYNV